MIGKVRYWIRNFFGFSRIETNGFLGLLLIVIIVLLAPLFFKAISTSTYTESANDKLLLDSLVYQLEQKKEVTRNATFTTKAAPFSFNPNVEELETFLLLGLTKDIGQRIINYRKAGGSFNVKSDFSKIYGLPQEEYDRLYAYIQLPDKLPPRNTNQNKETKSTFIKVDGTKKQPEKNAIVRFDINTCDTATLKQVYGIGPVLAERIAKYRSLLGGFVTKEQLNEVYGLKDEALQNIYKKGYIEEAFVPEKIMINEADVKAIAAHPYISYALAKAIHAYREQHGHFAQPEALLNIHILDSATFVKLKPYVAL